MRMTIDVMLDMEWAIEGRDCRLPVLPGLVTLWRRARDAGFVLDMLYVLDEPLHPGIAGQYNRETGDIWILHDPSDPSRMAAHLIHELAHAARRATVVPSTIDGYYRDEVATQRLAYRLARRWGMGELFPDEMLADYVRLMDRRREELPLAGDHAGSHRLTVASAALDDLVRLRHTYGWGDDAWDEALWGYAAEAGDPATCAAAESDRCAFRHIWSLGWGYGEGFDALDAPVSPAAARLVRDTLADAAESGASVARANTRRRQGRDGVTRREGRLPLWYARDVRVFLVAANEALLGHPEWAAEASWTLCGDAGDPVRYYALDVSYRANLGESPACPAPPAWRLWASLLGRRDEIEPVLHLYIRGWKRATALRCVPLRAGLEDLAMRESTLAH